MGRMLHDVGDEAGGVYARAVSRDMRGPRRTILTGT
jgi:hypothetical protein